MLLSTTTLRKQKLLENNAETFSLSAEKLTITILNLLFISQGNFQALQSATSALKNVHKELDVDKVQDVMHDLAEQHELSNEIANAISNPVGPLFNQQ